MIRTALTFLLSPIVALVAVLFYIAAAFAVAKVAPLVWLIHVTGLAAAFGVAFLLWTAIDVKSKPGRVRAMVFAGLVAASIAVLMQFYATQPIEVAASSETDRQFWTLSDGSRIAYQRCGTPHAGRDPVVFLHGGPAIPPRQSTVNTLCAIADMGFEVFIYDQIGSGESSRLDDISTYTVDRNVRDLEAIRAAIGAEHINIVAVSWGTVLASHYVAAHPNRVSRAVFVSPGVLGPRQGDEVQYDYSESASSDYDEISLPPFRVIVAGILARSNPNAAINFMSQEESGAVMDMLAADPALEFQGLCKGASVAASARDIGANYYANLMIAQDLQRVANPIETIRAIGPPPVLILRGACDYIPASALNRYRAAFPDLRVIEIESAGHSFLGARPDVVVPEAACFLANDNNDTCIADTGN